MDAYFDKNKDYTHLKGSINGVEKNIYILDGKKSFETFNIIDISYYLLKKKSFDINIKSNINNELVYFDLRYHFGVSDITDIIEYELKKNIDHYIKNINNDEKKNKYMQNILNDINLIKNKLEITKNNKNEVIKNEINNYKKNKEPQKYYLKKIMNKYKNQNLKSNIHKFIDDYYEEIISILYLSLDKLIIDIENFDIINKKNVYELMYSMKDLIIDIYRIFTNAYILKLILDKRSVEKCIVYCVSKHSINFIYFLVKNYDFKIIKIHNNVEKDINKIIKKIKNVDNVFDIHELFYLYKNIPYVNYDILCYDGNRIVCD